jgi:hypothetical protein
MADDTTFDGVRPGVYNIDWFSSSQVALYIGDVLIDEITSLNFVVQQNRRPLYGYADQYFRQMSKGQVIVQGQFTINFKEAGYLWLVLYNYQSKVISLGRQPFQVFSQEVMQQNIEEVTDGKLKQSERTQVFSTLADVYASLGGFSSTERAEGGIGKAENLFEIFENRVWRLSTEEALNLNRRADDVDLNPFDLYICYGDHTGDDRANHTIIKLADVYILGTSQQIEIDGMPIQESYSFVAKSRI